MTQDNPQAALINHNVQMAHAVCDQKAGLAQVNDWRKRCKDAQDAIHVYKGKMEMAEATSTLQKEACCNLAFLHLAQYLIVCASSRFCFTD